MNKTPAYLLAALAAANIAPACGTRGSGDMNISRETPGPAVPASADTVCPATGLPEAYLITDSCAGPFRIGAAIPDSVSGFTLSRSEETVTLPDGTAARVPAYTYEIGNEGWVRVTPAYDPATGLSDGRVGRILVYSDLFLTDRGIGAMSSVRDFADAYPDLHVDPSGDDGLSAFHTPSLPDVWFLIDSDLETGGPVYGFDETACFTAIRLGR